MKTIKEASEAILSDIARQSLRLALYRKVEGIFEGVEFPDDTYIWITQMYDGELYVEFSPNGEEKDFQPLTHKLCQKFNVKFDKERDYDEQSLKYIAKIDLPDGQKMKLTVSGVVPKSCEVKETVEYLTQDEIDEAKQKALDSVKLTRTVRKIICTDETE